MHPNTLQALQTFWHTHTLPTDGLSVHPALLAEGEYTSEPAIVTFTPPDTSTLQHLLRSLKAFRAQHQLTLRIKEHLPLRETTPTTLQESFLDTLWLDLKHCNRVIEYTPADFVITVETGITMGELNRILAPHQQCVALDYPAHWSLLEVLARDLPALNAGHQGYPRDWVLGMTVLSPEGVFCKSGGRVMKNVTGYDMSKLHMGAHHQYGLITQVHLKVRATPQCVVKQSFSLPPLHHPVDVTENNLPLKELPLSTALAAYTAGYHRNLTTLNTLWLAGEVLPTVAPQPLAVSKGGAIFSGFEAQVAADIQTLYATLAPHHPPLGNAETWVTLHPAVESDGENRVYAELPESLYTSSLNRTAHTVSEPFRPSSGLVVELAMSPHTLLTQCHQHLEALANAMRQHTSDSALSAQHPLRWSLEVLSGILVVHLPGDMMPSAPNENPVTQALLHWQQTLHAQGGVAQLLALWEPSPPSPERTAALHRFARSFNGIDDPLPESVTVQTYCQQLKQVVDPQALFGRMYEIPGTPS